MKKLLSLAIVISTLFILTACGGSDTKEVEKEVVVEVEKPVVELVQIESKCIVDNSCYIIGVTIPEQGLEKLSFGFSQTPVRAALIVNLVEHEIDDWGEIEINLSADDIVVLSVEQSNNEELFIWLDEYTSNGKTYSADNNTWNVVFGYQKPELHFGIKQITKNIQQQVHSVQFKVFGENNRSNLYQANVYTHDGCLIGSGDFGSSEPDVVEVLFIYQCHDDSYFANVDEERNYMVRFLSHTGELTWNVLDEGVILDSIEYYDTNGNMSTHTPNISNVKSAFRQLELTSPYYTQDSSTDVPAFIFDAIEIEVPEDGEYYIEIDSTDCPEFECSPYYMELINSQNGKISLDTLWVRFNDKATLTVYDADLSRVVVDITQCNITDSDWAASFVCPFRTK